MAAPRLLLLRVDDLHRASLLRPPASTTTSSAPRPRPSSSTSRDFLPRPRPAPLHLLCPELQAPPHDARGPPAPVKPSSAANEAYHGPASPSRSSARRPASKFVATDSNSNYCTLSSPATSSSWLCSGLPRPIASRSGDLRPGRPSFARIPPDQLPVTSSASDPVAHHRLSTLL